MQLILIKYGELTTKKQNRKVFIKQLEKNIKERIDAKVVTELSRMFIEVEDTEVNKTLEALQTVFGIHKIVIGYKTTIDENDIKNKTLELLKKETFKTFKVETNRANKNYPITSMEFSKMLGGFILDNMDVKVDVHNPGLKVNIEIREKNAYIYFKEINGLGGYPVGVQGKGLLMLSGGIDSPVAGYLALKRGMSLDCIYFEAPPYTSIEAKNKVFKLVQKLKKYDSNIRIHIIPFTELQKSIYTNCDREYMITIMRRMMYRISEKLANKVKAKVIINGESIGQVASQTLTSMVVINEVTNMPVIRPVACLDKLEIIDISKKIDTYEISILPFEDCCTIFVPKHPVINPKLGKAVIEEEKINYNQMIEEILNTYETVSNFKTNFDSLL